MKQSRLLRAVIFDMDGLMLDTERIYHRTWRSAGAELGYHFSDKLLHGTTGRTFTDCYRWLQEQLGPDFPLARFQALWPHHWHHEVTQQGIPQKPGLVALLDWLETYQIPKAVATSTTHTEAHFTLRAGQIAGRFATVVTGDQITHGKPAPDIYLLAAARLGVDPTECMALEDSEAGVLAASAAGMYTVMVPDTKEPSPQVAAHAAHVFTTLHDVVALLQRDDSACSLTPSRKGET
jgi:beta-phosphoglucomutase-like phosphatase (HAD superfamily)